jgi:Predicted deacylase
MSRLLAETPVLRSSRPSVDSLLEPLRASTDAEAARAGLTIETIAEFEQDRRRHEIVRIRVAGAYAGHDPIRLALFAGLHGDEPAGCASLVELVKACVADPALAAGYELFVYPVLNPTGYERGTRVNHSGKDLNREFWRNSSEVEVAAIERELRAREFAGIITLHADDTCEGVYGYTHGRVLNESLLTPALEAASRFLPIDTRAVIDGFPARAGLICQCFSGVLSAPPEQRPKPFDLIFETPAQADFETQVAAGTSALLSILKTYPGFISYAQDL